MVDKTKTIKLPDMPFMFGDARFRVIYGERDEKGGRELVGLIREDHVSILEGLMERDLDRKP